MRRADRPCFPKTWGEQRSRISRGPVRVYWFADAAPPLKAHPAVVANDAALPTSRRCGLTVANRAATRKQGSISPTAMVEEDHTAPSSNQLGISSSPATAAISSFITRAKHRLMKEGRGREIGVRYTEGSVRRRGSRCAHRPADRMHGRHASLGSRCSRASWRDGSSGRTGRRVSVAGVIEPALQAAESARPPRATHASSHL